MNEQQLKEHVDGVGLGHENWEFGDAPGLKYITRLPSREDVDGWELGNIRWDKPLNDVMRDYILGAIITTLVNLSIAAEPQGIKVYCDGDLVMIIPWEDIPGHQARGTV